MEHIAVGIRRFVALANLPLGRIHCLDGCDIFLLRHPDIQANNFGLFAFFENSLVIELEFPTSLLSADLSSVFARIPDFDLISFRLWGPCRPEIQIQGHCLASDRALPDRAVRFGNVGNQMINIKSI